MTSEHLQLNLENIQLSQEAFRASQLVRLEKERVLRKLQNLVCGLNSSESYAWYDQSTSSWKTWQRSLITEWTSFSGTFTRQGFMNVSGQLFPRQLLEQPTGVIDGSLLEYLPTPTAMDTKEDALKHATKLLQGKTHRSSGQPIQVSLSDAVMMEKIKQNPELMKIYQDHQMEERPYLPKQEKFVTYLRSQTTIKELEAKTTIKKTTIEHWFRKDKAGFSYPSIENWEKIKPHLKTIQFDKEMTTLKTKEWTTKSPMLPTPTTMDHLPQRSPEALKKQMEGARKGRTKLSTLREAVNPKTQELFNSMLPTPRAAKGMNMKLSEGMASLEHKKYLETEIAAKIHTYGDLPNIDSTPTGEDMYLNASFVEELMGFEIGHTDFGCSETQ